MKMRLPRKLKKELNKFMDQRRPDWLRRRTSFRLRRWFRQVARHLDDRTVYRLIVGRPPLENR